MNASFALGELDISISNGGNTIAGLLVDGNNFFVDENNNQAFDGGEVSDLLSALTKINVEGNNGAGTFIWQGDFTQSNNLASVSVSKVGTSQLLATASVLNDISISTNASNVEFGGNLSIGGNLTIDVDTQITNSANAKLTVTGQADLTAPTITLGNQLNDSINFGTLTFDSSGVVTIHEDSSTKLVGSITAGSLTLTSTSSIELDSAATLVATTAVQIEATGADSDLQINGDMQTTNNGSLTLKAADSIFLGASGSIDADGTGNVTLTANVDLLNGNSDDRIQMSDGATITSDTGTILLSAEGADGGNVSLGTLSTGNNSALAIEIRTNSAITDNTAAETANLAASTGTIALTAVTGAIGGAADADIDINSVNLVFAAAAGAVHITDLTGGVRVSGASQADGGGSLTANSPLVIAANVTVGASFTFTAGNSGAAGDDLTIDAGVIVTLNSAANSQLTFDAGDDIIINGSISTIGGGAHTVQLRADREDLGGDEGNLDGDRGGISQLGTAPVEVSTNTLLMSAGEGISIDTTVSAITATNLRTGNIVIRETDGVTLTSVTNSAGSVDVSAGGLITATSVSAAGAGSNVTLSTTTGGIAVTSVIAANNVTLTATAGDITSGTITGTAGTVSITADVGNVTVGTITAGAAVTIATPFGSINDAQDDALTDITAGTTITLTANSGIAGAAVDGRLELAAGSNVTATSTAGNIVLRGLGAITLTNVAASAGSVDVLAAGAVTATAVNAAGAGNDVSISTTTGGIAVTNVTAADTVTLIATVGDITSGTITGTAGSVSITANAGNVTVGAITAGTAVSIATPGGSINDAQNDALVDITAGTTISLIASTGIAGAAADGRLELAAGSIVTATSATGNIVLRGLGAITLTNVAASAGSVDVLAAGAVTATAVNAAGAGNDVSISTSTGGIAVTNVTAADTVTLIATAGDITSGTITGTAGSVNITANTGNVTVGAITAGTAVSIATPTGSINDAQDDALVDITAGTTISLIASTGVAGAALDGRLELATNSNVTATSTTGNIVLRGLGALTLTNVAASAGSVDVLAAGAVAAAAVNAAGAGNDVSISTTAGGIAVTNVTAADTVTLIATAGDITSGTITGTTGSVNITANGGNVTVGAITAGTAVTIATPAGSINDAQNDALVDITAGTTISLIASTGIAGAAADGRLELAAGSNVTATSTTGNIVLRGLGAITLTNVAASAGSVDVLAAGTVTATAVNAAGAGNDVSISTTTGGIAVTNVTAADTVTLIATAGDITSGTITGTAGSVNITANSGNVTVGAITAGTAVTIATPGGSINDAQNDALVDITAGTTISLIASAGIAGAAADGRLELAANSIVTATSTTGDIVLRGLGAITLTNVAASAGSVDVLAAGTVNVTAASAAGAGNDVLISTSTGNIAVTSVIATDAVTLIATAGSINDAQNDAIVDITAGGLITLTANTGIAGLAADGRLELAAGSTVVATSTTGNIVLRGLGTLNLQNVVASNGAIDVTAVGELTAQNVDSSGIDADANDITLASTGSNVRLRSVLAGPTLGDVTITAQVNIIDDDPLPDTLDVRGDDVTLTATTGSIGATSSDIFNATVNTIEVVAGDLNATATAGVIALDATVTGTLTLNTNTAWIQSNGDLNATVLTITVTNLALVADADNNGSGTLMLGNSVTVAGDLRIQGADVTAADGSIDLAAARLMFVSGQGETINVNAAQLDATTGGSLVANALTSVELIDLNRDNVALQTLVGNGSITLTSAGSILVTDDVIAGVDGIQTSLGGISLSALNPNANIVVNDLILADNGNISIRAENDVIVGAAISPNEALDNDNLLVITTIDGNIAIHADADDDRNGVGGALTMVDGARVIAGRVASAYAPNVNGNPSVTAIALGAVSKPLGNAQIVVSSDEDTTIGSLQSTNESNSAISVTSFSGAIVDAGDASGDSNLLAQFGDGIGHDALVNLQASTGIGSANPLETEVFRLSALNTTSGDIRLREVASGGNLILDNARNLSAAGNVTIQVDNGDLRIDGLVRSAGASVTLQAGLGSIDEGAVSARIEASSLSLLAGEYIHLSDVSVNTLSSVQLTPTAGNQGLNAGVGQVLNTHANSNSTRFLNQLTTVPGASTNPGLNAEFQLENQYAFFLRNDKALIVQSIDAQGANPNVYVETQGNSTLRVSGNVETTSSNVAEGEIVLVAGGTLVIDPGARLETTNSTAFAQLITQIAMNPTFFSGGEGIEPDSLTMTSSQFVLAASQGLFVDFNHHIFQRVAMQFGTTGEAGFMAIVGYADAVFNVFDTASDQGINETHSPLDASPILAFPQNPLLAAVFTRSTAFSEAFLDANAVLPTDAIVRRSSDFFLFENAVAGNNIRDLAFNSAPIMGALSQGQQGALPIPPEIPPLKGPIPISFANAPNLSTINVYLPTVIELNDIVEKPIEVSVYRVAFADEDHDGQPDQNELPNQQAILEELGPEKKVRDVQSKTGGTPTPEEVDNAKAEIKADPESPAGVYAIVETDANGKEIVVDIFSIRDYAEVEVEGKDEMPLQPILAPQNDQPAPPAAQPANQDGAALMPAVGDANNAVVSKNEETDANSISGQRNRLASAGVLFSSLWMIRAGTPRKPSADEDDSNVPVALTSRERRRKKLRSALGK